MQSCNAITDYSTANITAQISDTYNNCFVLSGIIEDNNGKRSKQCCFIENGISYRLWVKDTPKNLKYRQLTYENARNTLHDIIKLKGHKKGYDTLRVSIWLENAKWGNLSLFCIDFDKYNEQSAFFKTAYSLADKVTRSQSGGYHMWYGIDRQKAEPLFKQINLTTREGTKSFVRSIGNETDGNKVDLFCESGNLIHEFEQWDNNTGLTDKTTALFELLNNHFTFKERANVTDIDYWKNAENKSIAIEGLPHDVLIEQMTKEQWIIFEDLKTISPNCTQREWYRTGVDIKHIFGEELGGSVFLYWSKAGLTFQEQSLANTWNDICNRNNSLWNSKWADIIDNEANAFDTAIIEHEITKNNDKQDERQNEHPHEKPYQNKSNSLSNTNKTPLEYKGLTIKHKENSDKFILPNEYNKEITAYKAIELLADEASKPAKVFKSFKKQIKFNNNKIQILPYSERAKVIFHFRQLYNKPPILQNAADIADFINTANKNTDNRELDRNWRACKNVTETQAEAASLLVYYGWAAKYDEAFPREENAFYTVSAETDKRHYEIVEDDISLRFNAIQSKGQSQKAINIISNSRINNKAKYKNLLSILNPLLWRYDDIKMGLTQESIDICDMRIKDYIDELLNAILENGETREQHIFSTKIDNSDIYVEWAEPQKFVISMDDLQFTDYQYNINTENAVANAVKSGAERSRKAAEENIKNIIGNEWTTQELYAQGITKDIIPRLIANGLIERTKRGHYRRISS